MEYQDGLPYDDVYNARRMVTGKMVAIMDKHLNRRKLILISQPTRAFKKNEIVELIANDEKLVNITL